MGSNTLEQTSDGRLELCAISRFEDIKHFAFSGLGLDLEARDLFRSAIRQTHDKTAPVGFVSNNRDHVEVFQSTLCAANAGGIHRGQNAQIVG